MSKTPQVKPMPATIVESGELWGRYPARCQCGCPIRRLGFAWLGCLTTDADWLFDYIVEARNEVASLQGKAASYDRSAWRRIFGDSPLHGLPKAFNANLKENENERTL